jgi:hypothetical protein
VSRWLTDISTLKMEAIHSSETSVHTRSTRRHIPEDGILDKFYVHITFLYVSVCVCTHRKIIKDKVTDDITLHIYILTYIHTYIGT